MNKSPFFAMSHAVGVACIKVIDYFYEWPFSKRYLITLLGPMLWTNRIDASTAASHIVSGNRRTILLKTTK